MQLLLSFTPCGRQADHQTLYDILHIPASASPSELRVAFKLRDLELKTAGAPHSQRLALERAFNIVGHPELRACYDALLADPESPCGISVRWSWLSTRCWRAFPRRTNILRSSHSCVFAGAPASTIPCSTA